MFAQMSNFLENSLSMQQCGFRESYRVQLCLLAFAADRGKTFGDLLTNLSKTFDCLDHERLIAKLNAYGFSLPALKLVNHSLSQRKQRTKVSNTYRFWLFLVKLFSVYHKT